MVEEDLENDFTDASERDVLIIGASGGIATAVLNQEVARLKNNSGRVFAISRSKLKDVDSESVQTLQCSRQDDDQRAEAVTWLKNQQAQLQRVYICTGVLHGDAFSPERKLESLDASAMAQVMQINAFLPMLWIRDLLSLLKTSLPKDLVVFSARVGSISDNRLGGWYSYRASKAALNMLLKSAAIELTRRQCHTRVLAFHPGTTDTPLSRPFQSNVPKDKLFTPDFVARQLLDYLAKSSARRDMEFVDWAHQPVGW